MMKPPTYAVLFKGQWHICYLVLATEYAPTNTGTAWDDAPNWDDTPVWSEIPSTAYICKFDEATHVIRLKEPM